MPFWEDMPESILPKINHIRKISVQQSIMEIVYQIKLLNLLMTLKR